MHEIKISYELLLYAKRHKQRIADVVLALQDLSRTPPAAGSTPKITGLGSSPGRSSPGKSPGIHSALGGQDTKDSASRRRRWYLGIQSKKDPAHVMTEVYKALMSLQCSWHQVNNYRILVLKNFQLNSNPNDLLSVSY